MRRYVDAVAGTGARIVDTRQTLPGTAGQILQLIDRAQDGADLLAKQFRVIERQPDRPPAHERVRLALGGLFI